MDKRIIERKDGDKWVRVNFMDLQAGDVFRMFEPDTMELAHGLAEITAVSEAYINDNGQGEIRCEDDENAN